MATMYFRGTTNANWSVGSNWIGGTGVAPLISDDVVFDGTSPACTIDAAANCRSINMSAYTSTLTHNNFDLNIGNASGGALNFSGAWTYNPISVNARLVFLATGNSTPHLLTWGGKNPGSVNFTGASGKWDFVGDCVSKFPATSTFQPQTASGIVNLNGYNISFGAVYKDAAGTFNMTNSTVTLGIVAAGGNYSWVSVGGTITSTGSTIIIKSPGDSSSALASTPYIQTSKTLNNVTFEGLSGTFRLNTGFTLTGTLTVNAIGPLAQLVLYGIPITVNNLVTTGSAVNRLMIKSEALGTQRSITTGNGVNSVAFTNFQDINAITTGTSSWNFQNADPTLESVGNCLGNNGITFPNSLNLYPGDAVTAFASTNWTDVPWYSDQARATLSRIPLPQDDVVFDTLSISSGSAICNLPHLCRNITSSSGLPNNKYIAFGYSNITSYVYGSVTFTDNVGLTVQQNLTLCGRGVNGDPQQPHDFNIKSTSTFGAGTGSGITINSFGGTYRLVNDLVMYNAAANGITVTNGTFSTGGKNVTTSFLSSNNSNTRTIDISNSTFLIPQYSSQPSPVVNLGSGIQFISTNSTFMFGIWGSASATLGGYTFDKILFLMTANILTVSSFSCNSLAISMSNPNGTLQQLNGTTITILKEPKIKIGGVAGNFNIIGYLSPRAYISNKTGKPLSIAKAKLTNVTIIGPALYAEKSINGGNNSNACFYPIDTWSTAKTLAAWGLLSDAVLSGISAGQAGAVAALETLIQAAGSVLGTANGVAALLTSVAGQGMSPGQGASNASLVLTALLSAAANGSSTAQAALQTALAMATATPGVAGSTATLQTVIRLLGIAAGVSTATGDFGADLITMIELRILVRNALRIDVAVYEPLRVAVTSRNPLAITVI